MDRRTVTIMTASFIVAAFCIAASVVFLPLLYGTRELFESEKGAARHVFHDSVDIESVRIKIGGPLTWFGAGVTIGNVISFPSDRYDASREADRGWLVHELVHVWQYQHFGPGYIPASVWEQLTEEDAYAVRYDPAKAFREYDIEEQARIVQDFYLGRRPEFEPYVRQLRDE